MTTPVIIDAVAVAILAFFVLWGAHQGLLRSLTGLLTIVVALVGAGLIASALADSAARLAGPLVEERIRTQVDEAITAQASQKVEMPELDVEGGDEEFDIQDLLALMGLDQDVRDSLTEEIQEKAVDAGTTIAAAAVESVVRSVLYGVVFLLDDADTVMRKFRRAVTDSDNRIIVAPDKPGISNLITIYSVFSGISVAETEKKFEGVSYAEFKTQVGEAVVNRLAPVRQKYNELIADKAYLNKVMKEGAEKASYIASKTLSKVYRKVGFAQYK